MEGAIAGTEGRRLEGAAPPAPRPAASTPPPGRQPASPEVSREELVGRGEVVRPHEGTLVQWEEMRPE